MKKLGLTLALATILTFGTSQASADPGVIVSDLAQPAPTQCNTGIIVGDFAGVLLGDWAAGIIDDIFGSDCSATQPVTPGVIVSD